MDDRAVHKIEKHLARLAASAERIADALDAANEREAEWRKLMGALTEAPQPEPDPPADIPESERYRFR